MKEPKIINVDCPNCEAKKSIEITMGVITPKGFNIAVKKCSDCKKQYTANDLYETFKSKSK